jgi:hypothetical protein
VNSWLLFPAQCHKFTNEPLPAATEYCNFFALSAPSLSLRATYSQINPKEDLDGFCEKDNFVPHLKNRIENK